MEFTVYVETEDPRFADRTFQLRDEHGDVYDAFPTPRVGLMKLRKK